MKQLENTTVKQWSIKLNQGHGWKCRSFHGIDRLLELESFRATWPNRSLCCAQLRIHRSIPRSSGTPSVISKFGGSWSDHVWERNQSRQWNLHKKWLETNRNNGKNNGNQWTSMDLGWIKPGDSAATCRAVIWTVCGSPAGHLRNHVAATRHNDVQYLQYLL